jgi:hypothetical protein
MKDKKQNPKNFSDLLFERYLISQGILDFAYEKEHTHTDNKPDFIFTQNTHDYIFDVKEFDGIGIVEGHICFSPSYKKIRDKITQATKQFKHFKESPCCLVLYSFDYAIDIDLHSPNTVYGSMYGDAGWQIPIVQDKEKSYSPNKTTPSFGGNKNKNRGKMLRYSDKGANHPIAPQNTTISALIVLREFRNSPFGYIETLRNSNDNNFDLEGSKAGLIIYENCYARKPFPKDLFCGEFDTRFGFDGKSIKKEFVGNKILNNGLEIDKENKFLIYFE